jgi:hypothetical protein
MYARTTTLRGNPRAMEQAIAVVRDEWMPTTTDLDGCTGLSMLAGRRSGRCIVTSGWRTEESMRDSANSMRSSRARLASVLGGLPMVSEWGIGMMHRV